MKDGHDDHEELTDYDHKLCMTGAVIFDDSSGLV